MRGEARVLMPLPREGFDPTESSIPWRILTDAGHEVIFATPDGRKAAADPIMVTGRGLGLLKKALAATPEARQTYARMEKSAPFSAPLAYSALSEREFDALLLPGGHAKGMREYIESPLLHRLVAAFFASGKPVGAICHGVALVGRSKTDDGARSVLHGRQTTALPAWMELSAWWLTRWWLGDYYRTYPWTVQSEVSAALEKPSDFRRGPLSLARDSASALDLGFTVGCGNYVSARWPGDAHRLGIEFLRRLSKNGG